MRRSYFSYVDGIWSSDFFALKVQLNSIFGIDSINSNEQQQSKTCHKIRQKAQNNAVNQK